MALIFSQNKLSFKILTRQTFFDGTISTYDYIQQFPALEQPCGYELAEIDLNFRHPDAISFEDAWEKVYQQILLKAKPLKDTVARNYLSKLLPSNERFIALLVLPYLFPPTALRVKNGKKIKLSRGEVAKNFIPLYKNINEEEQGAAQQLQQNSELNVATQPRVVFVGDLDEHVQGFVYIIDTKIAFGPVESVSACLSYYIALNAQYQEQTKHIWIFLQKLCNLNSEVLEKFASVETLINEIIG